MPATTTKTQTSESETLRNQLNTLLPKLADRDTESQSLTSLTSLLPSLPPSLIPTLLSSLSSHLSPSSPPSLRRHSLALLSLLSPPQLSPHLSIILSLPLRLIADPNSQVQHSLLSIIRHISPLFPLSAPLLRPIVSSLFKQPEMNAQSTASQSLAAAIECSTASDVAGFVRKCIPKLVRLYGSAGFGAKAAMMGVLGSGVKAGGVEGDAEVLGSVVGVMVEGLGSAEWSVRKAAAEGLAKVGVREREMLGGWRDWCLEAFEKRRFDKVKIVREEMNRMLEVWRDIPEAHSECTNVLPVTGVKLQNFSEHKDSASDAGYQNVAIGSSSVRSSSPIVVKRNKAKTSRSPPPSASPIPVARKNAPSVRRKILSPPLSRKNDKKTADCRAESEILGKDASGEKLHNVNEVGPCGVRSNLEVRRMLFLKNFEEKENMLAETKLALEVPLRGSDSRVLTSGYEIKADEIQTSQKDGDLSSIQKQLMQIENQQSSILDLLQKFIGNSQNGIHSLETRVNGLEKTLDEISRDFALSSRRMHNDTAANTCCGIPGAEFLSPKFWRKTEGKYSSRLSMSDMERLTEKDSKGSFRWGKHKYGIRGEIVTNPLAEINPLSRASTDISSNTVVKSVIHDDRVEYTCGRV